MSAKRKRPNPHESSAITAGPRLPPARRSRVALGITAAAALGEFQLQVCSECATVQYPPREACHKCLSPKLRWRAQSGRGELLSDTILYHSNEAYFRDRLPWRIGMVRLDIGPTVIAHLHSAVECAPCRVVLRARLDRAGQAVLVAVGETHGSSEEGELMATDSRFSEMASDPRQRNVLITDGSCALGKALVKALGQAGADAIWVGYRQSWKNTPEFEAFAALDDVRLVPLEVTDTQSVTHLAAELGSTVDILINTAQLHRPYGICADDGVESARSEMEVNYLGLLRLAQAFGPIMRARSADGNSSMMAWVNVLSVYALSNFPPHGTYSASEAAAYSLAQCLRAQMQPAGVRVMNVFPGPTDEECNARLPPPKLGAEALAKAIVTGLRNGVEDVFPGDVAREWLARWRENPKILERELAVSQ